MSKEDTWEALKGPSRKSCSNCSHWGDLKYCSMKMCGSYSGIIRDWPAQRKALPGWEFELNG